MKTYEEYLSLVEHALGPMLESLGEIPEQLLKAMISHTANAAELPKTAALKIAGISCQPVISKTLSPCRRKPLKKAVKTLKKIKITHQRTILRVLKENIFIEYSFLYD